MSKENRGGFGKVLLGIAIAAGSMIAYKKIPVVKETTDKIINGATNMVKKAGEKLSKAGKKDNAPAENKKGE